jgi:hypothetical protein
MELRILELIAPRWPARRRLLADIAEKVKNRTAPKPASFPRGAESRFVACLGRFPMKASYRHVINCSDRRCSLFGLDRKSPADGQTAANDPERAARAGISARPRRVPGFRPNVIKPFSQF